MENNIEEQTTQPQQQAAYKEYSTPIAILLAGVMVSASIVFSGGISSVPAGTLAAQANAPVAPEITEQDYVRGNPNAPVTVIEYSDFECPFCSRFHPTMKQILVEYTDQVRWVYRHFPLANIHPEAIPSAEASECVAEQKGSEGFWEFADVMFENQHNLGSDFYRATAVAIGVNLDQYDTCVATRKYEEKVASDTAGGVNLGITGTPGTFINAVPVKGALPYETIRAIVEDELQNSEN